MDVGTFKQKLSVFSVCPEDLCSASLRFNVALKDPTSLFYLSQSRGAKKVTMQIKYSREI
jgi:hypothetical protein